MDWRAKGREAGATAVAGQRYRALALLSEPASAQIPYLRSRFAELLHAVRWSGAQHPAGELWADVLEQRALRLLSEGLREYVTEIAGGAESKKKSPNRAVDYGREPAEGESRG